MSCQFIEHSDNQIKDTTQIITTIFSRGDIPYFWQLDKLSPDTIYILANKYYNPQWPKRLNKITVSYISDNRLNRHVNKPWEKEYDGRLRYIITGFEIASDTATVAVYNFNTVTNFTSKLLKTKDKWVIKEQGTIMD